MSAWWPIVIGATSAGLYGFTVGRIAPDELVLLLGAIPAGVIVMLVAALDRG